MKVEEPPPWTSPVPLMIVKGWMVHGLSYALRAKIFNDLEKTLVLFP
jgi:hypothetical protein